MNIRRKCVHSDPCCASCLEARRSKSRVSTKAWRDKNSDRVKSFPSRSLATAYTKRWQAKNSSKVKESQAKFRAKPENREKARLRASCWRAENKDRARSSEMAWKSKNKDKVRSMGVAHNNRRRALKKDLFVEDVDVLEIAKAQCGICYLCSTAMGSDITLDHIVPLTKGGPHSESNSAACHKSCNSSKGNRSILQFFLRRRTAEVGV